MVSHGITEVRQRESYLIKRQDITPIPNSHPPERLRGSIYIRPSKASSTTIVCAMHDLHKLFHQIMCDYLVMTVDNCEDE